MAWIENPFSRIFICRLIRLKFFFPRNIYIFFFFEMLKLESLTAHRHLCLSFGLGLGWVR
jgi:hypothetical protein